LRARFTSAPPPVRPQDFSNRASWACAIQISDPRLLPLSKAN
jgi:hypothetical protein